VVHAAPDQRPIIVALAGPNGAGKSTFHAAFLREAGLRFVNADEISAATGADAYAAASVAARIRQELVTQGESFVFETVLSDPVGEKVAWLEAVAITGYTVVMCFIGIPGPDASLERVAMRVSQGGHDVPDEKLLARYARTMANLARAVRRLSFVLVFDNGDLAEPYRRVAEYEHGRRVFAADRAPDWLPARAR
jgi:predicted ABC-type ATPase